MLAIGVTLGVDKFSCCYIIVIVMMQIITITPSWQIHLPVSFRKKLGLNEPGVMELTLREDALILRPRKSSILSMAGKYRDQKPNKKINLETVREEIDYSSL